MKSEKPAPTGSPQNDFKRESTASTEQRQRESFLDDEPETLGESGSPWDYERCPHCHRPSWTFVEYLIEAARADERTRLSFDEFSDMLERGRRWREEQSHGRRRLLRAI